MKILSIPRSSACFLTICEPGTTIARTLDETFFPLTTFDAAIRSSKRAFVQEPMKTRSMYISVIGIPGFRSIYCNAFSTPFC